MGISATEAATMVQAGIVLGLSPERLADEQPENELEVDAFQLGKTPVTHRQFARFVAGGGYTNHLLWPALIKDVGAKMKAVLATYVDETGKPGPSTWKNGACPPGHDDHPVHGISFYEAAACAKFLEGRLPSEREWEYAARYPDGRSFPWGNNIRSKDLANFSAKKLHATTPAGKFKDGASKLGLLDLAGNVHEWTDTHYGPYKGGVARYGFMIDSTARVARGGDFDGEFWDLRTTSRFAVNARQRFMGLGFRLAKGKPMAKGAT
jgi:formylglycine-generating enzyme required for sulfatase activity